jgi:hypothetical protein
MDRRNPPTTPPICLDVNIRGVVIPTWVAITLASIAALAAGIVLLAVVMFKTATESLVHSQLQQTKEIRLLGLYISDIENVLIRNGIAKREDFTDSKEKGVN